MVAQQIADRRVRNLCVNARLVKQAEIVNRDAVLLVLLQIAEVIMRESVIVLWVDVLVSVRIHQHPVRGIIHWRLENETAIAPGTLDERNQAVGSEVARDGKVLHLDVSGDRIVAVKGTSRHEIRGGNYSLHRGEARAFFGIEQRAQDGLLFRGGQAVNADQARFQKRSSKAIHLLVSDGV